MKDYKAKKRELAHSQESLELMRAKRGEKQQDTLDRIGYREDKEYNDTVSYLAW